MRSSIITRAQRLTEGDLQSSKSPPLLASVALRARVSLSPSLPFSLARTAPQPIRTRTVPLAVFLFLVVSLLATTAVAQHRYAIPGYHVIFDDFDYDAAGYPDTTGTRQLFGENPWLDRNGEAGYTGYAWYYYNWRWQNEGKTIHPSARIEMDTRSPHSVKLVASEGYTREFLQKNEVPLQLQSGFVHEQGTWVVSAKFADLEVIPYFTQAFWLISPMVTSERHGGVKSWSELNFEWQNWFAVLSQPGTNAWNTDLSDDAWAPENQWVERRGYAGAVFPDGQIPSSQRRTYMANGVRMYDLEKGLLNTGETAGGIPLRNSRLPDAETFTCYQSVDGRLIDITDPVACMDFILKDGAGNPNPWVTLLIQYDSRLARYALLVPAAQGEDYVYMESSVPLNRRSLPLLVNLGMHTPNEVIVLGDGENATFEIGWFYYSPSTDIDHWDVLDDVRAFRERGWSRVNLDAESLTAPDPLPWQIRSLRTPTSEDPGWIVDTTIRGTNRVEVQWNYRTRTGPDELFSDWSGWQSRGFRFELDAPVYQIELDVRAKDHNAPEIGDRRFWADVLCTRHTYATGVTSLCEGGLIEDSHRSLEQVPHSYVLDTNYPNPFHTATTIRFGLPFKTDVTLSIYDVLGRHVTRLVDQTLGGGYYSVTWDASNLPAGTYFYQLEAGGFVRTNAMILIR